MAGAQRVVFGDSQVGTQADLQRNRQRFTRKGGKTGILLVHGFTGSPGELLPLGEHLANKNYTVDIPVLAGHCTSLEDINRTTMKDWVNSAESAFEELRAKTDRVVLIGHSMGGVIALYLAARHHVSGLVSICTPIYVTNRFAWMAPLIGTVWKIKPERGPIDPAIAPYLGGYLDGTPVPAVGQLMKLIRLTKRDLPEISSPILIQQSELDRTVRPESARFVYNHVGSVQKQLKWYANSGHMLPVDVDREAAFADIDIFIQQLEVGS